MRAHSDLRRRLDGAEPAARFLPEHEFWSPATWTHFRYVVLAHLKKEGAHSLDELAKSPPEILGLRLSRMELAAALESARRRRLIERLDGGGRAGSIGKDDEWILTASGHDALRHGASDLQRLVQGLTRYADRFSFLLPLLAALGLGTALSGAEWGLAALLLLMLVSLAWAATKVRKRRLGINPGHRLAADWARWAVERPDLYRHAMRPFPWRWLLMALLTFPVASIAAGSIDLLKDNGFFQALLLAAAWAPFVPVLNWMTRWSDIATEAQSARVREAFGRSSLPSS